jgi:pimeloyl-ACP methyl ester carboxylesterase
MPVSARSAQPRWYILALLAAMLALPMQQTAWAATPPPPAVDLDKFETLKKTVALPDGVKLAYVSWGDPAGKPVVLIHGYTDNALDWVPLLPYLAKTDRLIVVDIRGHGKSSKPECCYTRFDLAYDIKLLLDALHIPKADIVGHSMGSFIAQTLAEFWPEQVNHVVLISSTALPLQYDATWIRNLKETPAADSPQMVAWFSSPTPVNPDILRRQRRDAAAIPLQIWLAVLDQGLQGIELQSTLPRLKAPTLLIWGSEDFIMKPADRDALRAALPDAKVMIYDGLGHNPFWEQPAAVGDLINGFLDGKP